MIQAIAEAEGDLDKVGYLVRKSSVWQNIRTHILPQLRYAKCRFELK